VPATIEAGIASDGKSFTFHELRHTAAAFMIDEGGDPSSGDAPHGSLRYPDHVQPLRALFPIVRTSW
jgi:integrase